jgi:hypothetical protein
MGLDRTSSTFKPFVTSGTSLVMINLPQNLSDAVAFDKRCDPPMDRHGTRRNKVSLLTSLVGKLSLQHKVRGPRFCSYFITSVHHNP